MITPKNNPPLLTIDDVYEGQTLICIWSIAPQWYKVGGEYKVVEKCLFDENTYEKNFIWVTTDDPRNDSEFYRLSDLNHPDLMQGYLVRFVPEECFTKKELFIFKLSGQIPARYL